MNHIGLARDWLLLQGIRLRRSWRAAETAPLRGPVAWIVDHASILIGVGGAILSAIGYTHVAEFGRQLGVSPSDLGIGTSTYVVVAGISVAFVGGLVVVLLLGGRLGSRLAPWAWGMPNRDFFVVSLLFTGAAIVITIVIGLVFRFGPPGVELAGRVLSLLVFFLLIGGSCGLMFSLIPRSALKQWIGWTVLAVLVSVGIATTLDDEAAQLADSARWAATHGEPIVPSSSFLAMVIRPSGGIITLADGTSFCGVRISDRVFLRPDPAQPDVVATVVSDARLFVSTPTGC